MTATDEFLHAIQQAGLTAPETIIADGTLHRFASNGDRDDDAGWYCLFSDGIPAGVFGCWRSGLKQTWCGKSNRQMTEKECAEYRRRIEVARRQRETEERRQHAEAAQRAQQLWDAARPAAKTHPYLQRKGIRVHGLRVGTDGRLIVPIYRGGLLSSVEFIAADGDKKYLSGGAKQGGCFPFGDLEHAHTLLLGEGFATVATLHEATGYPAVMAFDATNLLPVAQQLRQQYPTAVIVLVADNDLRDDETPNTGVEAATAAAKAIDGVLAIPELDGKKCDFNDLACAKGLDAVREKIAAALKPPPCILDEVHAFLGRFVAYPSEAAHIAHTLWIGHTHLMEKWESTPRIAFLSPESGSGKTRALEVTETTVPRPAESVNATAAYLFRKVSDLNGLPTILYDEIDTLFGPKAKEHEEVRGLINAGHRRGAVAGRCVVKGKQIETEEFPAYCAVALAGLGNLPDTILTRSVIIKMRRRAPTEVVEPYRRRVHAPEGYRLRDRLVQWAVEVGPTLNLYPTMPDGITDRAADVWEALLSVADAAGGDWPTRARVTAVTLVTDALAGSPSLGVRLLADLKIVFGDKDAASTVDLLSSLIELEESPWGDLRGKPLEGRRLGKLLHPYGVSSKTIRMGNETVKGYTKESLWDAWSRYLPTEKAGVAAPTDLTTKVTKVTPVTETGKDGVGSPPNGSVTSVTEETEMPDVGDLFFEEEPDVR